MSRWLVPGVPLALLVAASPPAGAQSAPVCPAGVVAQPSFTVQDVEAQSDTSFTATHPIQVDVSFSGGGAVDESTVQFSAPPGVPLFRAGGPVGKRLDLGPTRVALQPAAAGPLPITASWTQDNGSGTGNCERRLRSPHWLVGVQADDSAIGLNGKERDLGLRNKPLGYELQILQAGRLIGRLAAAGKCNSTICNFRTLKLQR